MSSARLDSPPQQDLPRTSASPARPRLTALLAHVVVPVNHFFDRAYQSRYNPFYRSGTLAVGLLAIVFLTGLYLLFVYDVAAPYRSIQGIQQQAWLGRWMRALHRYATDACMVAVVYHILQSQVQGKTWGPRMLAWLSGVLLLVVLWISAWTGYVMVWDQHGQLLALSGAKMMQSVPFLKDSLGQAFNGSTPVEASFFFMNLFLHIVLPLGMVFGLWVHTAKLARSVWFPLKPIWVGSSVALLGLSLVWPAPLLPEADLFAIPGVVEVDWFYAFWLPILSALSPQHALLFICLLLVVGVSLPWWWKPSKKDEPLPSSTNEANCTGCRQCATDCPYEAISMVPRDDGRLPHSRVDPALCVSCGICAASCDQLAIGPPHSIGSMQMSSLAAFDTTELTSTEKAEVITIVCEHNPGAHQHLASFAATRTGVRVYPTGCIGTLHTSILEELLTKCGGVFVWGCPSRNCLTREGVELLNLRTFHKRPPSVSRRIEPHRLALAPYSSAERSEVFSKLDAFQAGLQDGAGTATAAEPARVVRYLKSGLTSVLLLLAIGTLSQLPMGEPATTGVLRIGAHIPGLAIEDCRQLSAEELAQRPLHMRRPTECSKIAPTYVLSVSIDDSHVLRRTVDHAGIRSDRPLFLDEDIDVTPGPHRFVVDLRPQDDSLEKAPRLQLQTSVEVEPSQIYLVGYDSEKRALQLTQ
jgi:ferredoxin